MGSFILTVIVISDDSFHIGKFWCTSRETEPLSCSDNCAFWSPAQLYSFFMYIGDVQCTNQHFLHACWRNGVHASWDAWNLSAIHNPYEEYIPSAKEHLCLTAIPHVYSTYWELMCYYHICVNISKMHGQGVHHKSWNIFFKIWKIISVVSICEIPGTWTPSMKELAPTLQ